MAKSKCLKECDASCGQGQIGPAILSKLEDGYKKLQNASTKSLLKKHLTPDIFEELKMKKTSYGSTLLDCIRSGVENPDSGVGVYAPDPDAYVVFGALFNPIIKDYHKEYKGAQPATEWGDPNTFGNVDPDQKYVQSTRIRCGRSLAGYAFNPCLSEAQYREIEKKMIQTFKGLTDEFEGTYYPLEGMSKSVQDQLIDDHFLFKEGDRFLRDANANRFWPAGRGIFHNDEKTFLVWVGEEDHIRIISMQPDGNIGEVYKRLTEGVKKIEGKMKLSRNEKLGYLTFCPSNLGTTIRASVHIKLPKLSAKYDEFVKLAETYKLQVRGTRGEHSGADCGIYDVSNKIRLGITEYEAVKMMYDGIQALITKEKEM